MRILKKLSGVAILAACVAGTSPAAAEDFYKDKHLDVIINFAPGGPTDIEGRLVARHLAKHIAGNPKVVVKNVSGAGGLVGLNYMGEVAKPDGQTMGYFTSAYEYQILEDPALRVPLDKFGIVGGVGGAQVSYIRTDVAPGMKKPEDLMKAEPFLVGGLGPSSFKDILMRMSLDLLGVKYRIITGFRGNAGTRHAVQQNEVQFTNESLAGYRSVVVPTMVKTGAVIPIFYYEVWKDGKPTASPDVPELKTFYDYYVSAKGQKPSGQLWDAYRISNSFATNFLRTIVLPPNSPPEALAALRKAFAELQNDKDFQKDAAKTFSSVPQFVLGADAKKYVDDLLTEAAGVRGFMKEYVAQVRK